MMKLSVYAAFMNSGKIRTVESRRLRPTLIHATRRANDQRLHKSELMANAEKSIEALQYE
jgi:hypothetical protein